MSLTKEQENQDLILEAIKNFESLEVDDLLRAKLKQLKTQRYAIDLNIARIEKILEPNLVKVLPSSFSSGTTAKGAIIMNNNLNEDEVTSEEVLSKISLEDIKTALLIFAKEKRSYFLLQDVKISFFQEIYKTKNGRKFLTQKFQYVLKDLIKSGVVISKRNPDKNHAHENLYFFKEEAFAGMK